MNKTKAGLLILFLIAFLPFAVSATEKIDPEIWKHFPSEPERETLMMGLTQAEPTVSVIIDLNESSQDEIVSLLGSNLKLGRKYSLVNSFFGEITRSGLEQLEANSKVQRVYYNYPIKTFLDASVPLINADNVWLKQINGINLTGENLAVCVLDTGVNSSHPSLNGRILAEHCYCWGDGSGCCPGGGIENTSAEDDFGHGSHVTGIITSNDSTYTGVAPKANIVAVKTMDDNGNGNWSDMISGLEWCINNRETYNISVISMSLGSVAYYNEYCDSLFPSTATIINNATYYNISVVIATGNENNVVNISAPACFSNAIRVASVSKTDAFAGYSNRGSGFPDILLAPGGLSSAKITSINYLGGFTGEYGTSMATPHVAGAILLMQQYRNLLGLGGLAPADAENYLINTGKAINDTGGTGLNFTRINVFDAALPSAENVTIMPAGPNTADDLICSYDYYGLSDENTSLRIIKWFNNSAVKAALENETLILSGNTTKGENWTCEVTPSDGTLTGSAVNSSATEILNSLPAIIMVYPNTYTKINGTVTLNVTVTDADSDTITNVSFYARNGTSNYTYQLLNSTTGSGTKEVAWNSSTVDEGWYILFVNATDGTGVSNNTSSLFIVDNNNSVPVVTINEPDSGEAWSGTKNIEWTATDADNDTINISLFYREDATDSWTTIIANTNNDGLHSWSTSGKSNGDEYQIKVDAIDPDGAIGSDNVTFEISNSADDDDDDETSSSSSDDDFSSFDLSDIGISHTFTTINAGETASWTITDSGYALTKISIKMKSLAENVKVTVSKLSSKPSTIPITPAGMAYKYLTITSNMFSIQLDKAIVEFKVTKSWVDTNNLSKSSVSLRKYSSGWKTMPTTLVKNDSTYYYYNSTLTDGFSTFVITGLEKEDEEPILTTSELTGAGLAIPELDLSGLSSWLADAVGGEGAGYTAVIFGIGLVLALVFITSRTEPGKPIVSFLHRGGRKHRGSHFSLFHKRSGGSSGTFSTRSESSKVLHSKVKEFRDFFSRSENRVKRVKKPGSSINPFKRKSRAIMRQPIKTTAGIPMSKITPKKNQ